MNADSRAATAHVLFLRWREPARGDAAGERLRAALAALVAGWEAPQRAVLEGSEGFAVATTLPAARVHAAALREARRDAGLAIALHHGPLEVRPDPACAARLDGETLRTAVSLADHAGRGAPAVSPAFTQALQAEAAPRRAALRNVLGVAGLALIVGAGLAGREARERYEAAHRPAMIQLDVQPSGEVFVDGESKGTAPPLVRMSVPPGPHRIEVRRGDAKPMQMDVQLQPGEELELKHVFETPPPAAPAGRAAPRAHRRNAPSSSNPLDQLKDKAKNLWRRLT